MRTLACVVLFVGVVSAKVFVQDTFGTSCSEWIKSSADGGDMTCDSEGIKTSQDAKFYHYSRKLPSAVDNSNSDLVVGLAISHPQNIDCGGGYIKLMPEMNPKDFKGETPYEIMFGPDICGYTKKVHAILTRDGENKLIKKEPRAESDTVTHYYMLNLKKDNTYEVYVDNEKKESGNLEDDWDLLPPKKIDDPSDSKPEDWVEDSEMDDPEDKKPEGWDKEPETVVDPEATKPEDWDEEEDGEWEAPTIPNPNFKGEWKPKRIENPKYKGVWKAKQLDNPKYNAEDAKTLYVRKPITHVGIDWWQVKSGSIVSAIVVTDDLAEGKKVFDDIVKPRADKEKKVKEEQEEKDRKEAEASAKDSEGAEAGAEGEEDEEGEF